MQIATFPELAINLIYTVLCLVPGFLALKTALYVGGGDVDLDQFDKSTWSLIGSGAALSVLYFMYVAGVALGTGRVALVVPVDLQWTELVAVYPVLLGVAVVIGYLVGRVVRVRASPDAAIESPGREGSSD